MSAQDGIRAVVLDLAGTTIDCGSLAPVGVFLEVFSRRGVEVTVAQAREPMGTHKREHIRRMCAMPSVAAAWRAARACDPTDADIDAMYDELTPLAMETLPRYAAPIAGALEVGRRLRDRGVRIANTTGYNLEMMGVALEAARGHGWEPDAAVAASEVPEGRPAPWLIWRALERLGTYPPSRVVKVGDTVPDIEAGRNAGVWTVGVALTGNEVGLDQASLDALTAEERRARGERARTRLLASGAHAVIDSVADLLACLDEIEACLATGERPASA